MPIEAIRVGTNAVRSWLQRRKQKRAEKKAAKAEAKASALEKKLFEKISSGESSPAKMVLPAFDTGSVSREESPGVIGVFKKYWPVAAAAVGLLLIVNFFKRKRR